MSKSDSMSARWTRLMNRVAARRATLRAPATAFVSQPEPRTIGSFRARSAACGGQLPVCRAPGAGPGSISGTCRPDNAFAEEMHGFGWLDDLAPLGDARARHARRRGLGLDRALWRGRGPGWTPDLTGRRLIRWINHALFLLATGRKDARSVLPLAGAADPFPVAPLARRRPGLPRFEALTGLIYAGLSLEGMEACGRPPCARWRAIAPRRSTPRGIATRNPEELLDVLRC